MLIIAIPKSASSSLISTLCSAHALQDLTSEFRNRYEHSLKTADEYTRLAKWHSELKEISEDWVKDSQRSDIICKHHFPPTEHNQNLLKDTKKVILLRNPKDIIEAYYRGEKTGAFPLQSADFAFCFTRDQWIKKAQDCGLLNELENFYTLWENHQGDKLVISYEELIEHPLKTLNRIEAYFDLPQSEDGDLSREKYSRHSSTPFIYRFIYRIYRRFVVALKRILNL